jgi:hypothetical protein
MSTPRRSFCAFLLIFFCLWNLPTATNRIQVSVNHLEKAVPLTFHYQLLDAFQLWIFVKRVNDIVEHIKNSRCMGAEPNSSLIGRVLVIHSAISCHER